MPVLKKKRSTLFANARPYGSLLSCLPLRWAAAFFLFRRFEHHSVAPLSSCASSLWLDHGHAKNNSRCRRRLLLAGPCSIQRNRTRIKLPRAPMPLSPLQVVSAPRAFGGVEPPPKSLGTGGARRWKGVKKGSRHGRPVLFVSVWCRFAGHSFPFSPKPPTRRRPRSPLSYANCRPLSGPACLHACACRCSCTLSVSQCCTPPPLQAP